MTLLFLILVTLLYPTGKVNKIATQITTIQSTNSPLLLRTEVIEWTQKAKDKIPD